MIRVLKYCVLSLIIAGSQVVGAIAEENKLAALLQKAPSPPNAVSYINVPALTKLTSDQNIPELISNKVQELWLVSELEIESLTPKYEAGYALMQSSATADSLSKKFHGYVDEVGPKKVVWTPNQMYLVPLEGNRVGFLRPANRSLVAQWLDPTVRSELTNYLFKQSEQPEQYLSFLLAINLENYFSPFIVEERLKEFDSTKDATIDGLAKTISTIKGASIIIGRNSLSECIASFEFGESPASLVPIAIPLLDDILKHNGSAVPDILDWKVSVKDNTLSLKGPISVSSLDSLIHIFSLTGHAEHIGRDNDPLADSTPTQSQPHSSAYDTKQYFDKVTSMVESIRDQSKQDVATRARWSDQRARRIDELSILNVDPEMVAYGAGVAELFRNSALNIRTRNIQANTQKMQLGGYYTSGYSANTNAEYRIGIQAGATGASSTDYRQTLSQIDQMTGDIRRKMTQKYSSAF